MDEVDDLEAKKCPKCNRLMIKQEADETFGTARIVINLMDKITLTGLIIGGIAIASVIIWMNFEQGIGLSFEILEP